MTSREDLETLFYRAITGGGPTGRLSARTHTVGNAIRELGRRVQQPWKAAGVSRETWRRWNLPPDAKNAQRPSKAKEAGLLAALRRLRLSTGHEAKVRASTGIHLHGEDQYEGVERDVGRSTLDWSPAQTQDVINRIMDAYLVRGIGAAVDVWLGAAPKSHGWAQEWMHPDQHGRSESIDLDRIDLTGDPAHAGRVGRARRR